MIEDQMTILKNEKFEDFIVPNTFYCTFMEGNGRHRALELGSIQIDEHVIELQPAKGPSDTLWLNRGVSRNS